MEGGEAVVVSLDAVEYRMRRPEGEFVKNKKISSDFLSHPAPDQDRVNLKPRPGGAYLSTYSWAGTVSSCKRASKGASFGTVK